MRTGRDCGRATTWDCLHYERGIRIYNKGYAHSNRGLNYNMSGLLSLCRMMSAVEPATALTIPEGVAKMLARRRPPAGAKFRQNQQEA